MWDLFMTYVKNRFLIKRTIYITKNTTFNFMNAPEESSKVLRIS